MGRRGAVESPIAVLAAFIQQRVWRQKDLATHVGLTPRALRRCLDSMAGSSFPLERAEEPPHVVWRMPEAWLPEAIALTRRNAQLAVRLLSRLESSEPRDRLLTLLLGPSALEHARKQPVETAPGVLACLEDARNGGVPVRVRYASTTSPGSDGAWRLLTVHELVYGDRPRFVATERGKPGLRTYRVDRVREAVLAPEGIARRADPAALRGYLAESVDGFHGDGPPVRCTFLVREPEARWVAGNLPIRDATATSQEEGLRVEVVTSAVRVLARFVVGLGAAARCLDEPLRGEVVRLASEVLDSSRTPKGPGPASAAPRPARRRGLVTG